MDEQLNIEQEFIRLLFIEHKKYLQISTELGISVKEVSKLAKKYTNERISINKIRALYKRKKYNNITFSQFYEAYKEHERKCCYCGITEEQINELFSQKKIYTKRSRTRGRSLELERVSPNESYENIDNLKLSCYWCNNAKSDEFSEEEYKIIGKAIAQVWKKRLEIKE